MDRTSKEIASTGEVLASVPLGTAVRTHILKVYEDPPLAAKAEDKKEIPLAAKEEKKDQAPRKAKAKARAIGEATLLTIEAAQLPSTTR